MARRSVDAKASRSAVPDYTDDADWTRKIVILNGAERLHTMRRKICIVGGYAVHLTKYGLSVLSVAP
jgi:hypothetical protein